MKRDITIYSILMILCVLFLTIGYSAFSDQLTITNSVAVVRADINLRITDVTTSSSYVNSYNYTSESITGEINIPAGESITYSVSVRNLRNVPVALSDISFSNGNNSLSTLSTTVNNTNYIKICDNKNVCKTNAYKTFDITITNTGNTTINANNFNANFTFTPFYTVTYNDDVIGDVLTGETFTYEFTNNTPSSITVDSGTCGTPSINNNILTITNVTSDLVLSSSSNGSGTWPDPYLLSDNTYHYNDLAAGSYQFVNLPGEPKITVDANHKVTKYELQNCGTGLALNGGSMESGILAFDNQKITINMEFTTNFSNSGNYYKCLVSALSSTNNSTYSGFRVTNKKNGMMYVHTMNNQSIASNGTGGYQIIDYSISNTYSKKDTRYTMTIVYDPSNENLTITINPGNINETGSITSITTAMRDATITIGGNGINTNNNMGQLTVNGLTVTKG